MTRGRIRRYSRAWTVAIVAVGFGACDELATDPPVIVELTPTSAWAGTVAVGELGSLTLDVRRSDGSTIRGVGISWTSSDADVVSVTTRSDGQGIAGEARVAGLASGSAVVTASVDHPSLTGSVDIPVSVEVGVWPDSLAVLEVDTAFLTIPAGATVVFESRDAAVLQVEGVEGGGARMTGRARGSATVLARVVESGYPDVTFQLPVQIVDIRAEESTIGVPRELTANSRALGVIGVLGAKGAVCEREGVSYRVRVADPTVASVRIVSPPCGDPRDPDRIFDCDGALCFLAYEELLLEVEALEPGVTDVLLLIDSPLGAERVLLRSTVQVRQRWVSVSAGYEHTCAVNYQGRVYCWGGNRSGEVGDGTFARRDFPVEILSAVPYDQVYAGGGPADAGLETPEAHTCARAGSRLDCWGSYRQGQLGASYICPPQPLSDPSQCALPVPSQYLDDPSNPVALGAGVPPYAAVTVGRAFTCVSAQTFLPGSPSGFEARCRGGPEEAILDPGSGHGELVFSGDEFVCVIAGQLQCRGTNEVGQLGNGSTSVVSDLQTVRTSATGGALTPDRGARRADGGARHACASGWGATPGADGVFVLEYGVWCWGDAESGQLGPDTGLEVCDAAGRACSAVARRVDFGPLEVVPDGVSDLGRASPVAIAVGDAFSCASMFLVGADLAGPALYCWGDNRWGQLGDATVSRSEPRFVRTPGLFDIAFDAGHGHACSVTFDGALYCWGDNRAGQLGIGSAEPFVATPTRVEG